MASSSSPSMPTRFANFESLLNVGSIPKALPIKLL